jgi:hypothetical protein
MMPGIRIVVKQIREDGNLWMPGRMTYKQSTPVIVDVDPDPEAGLRFIAQCDWGEDGIGKYSNYIPPNGRIEIYADPEAAEEEL